MSREVIHMQRILDGNSIVLGVCYYPEHWPEEIWANDLDRMLECGIQVVRIAEFSWNLTEPAEGYFTFDFYDRFLELCQEKGMKVIFGTPTATPPAWLTWKGNRVFTGHGIYGGIDQSFAGGNGGGCSGKGYV